MQEMKLKKSTGNNQGGFTIIELVVVILLLGILTATALPRFIDVTDEAHAAVVEGVTSGLQTGAALYRAAWFAAGQPATAPSQFGDGTLIPNITSGYPVGTAANISTANTLEDENTCLDVFNGLLQSGRPSAAAAVFSATPATLEANIEAQSADFVVTADAAASPTGCNFYYTGQYASGTSGSTQTIPVITYTVATGVVDDSGTFTLQED